MLLAQRKLAIASDSSHIDLLNDASGNNEDIVTLSYDNVHRYVTGKIRSEYVRYMDGRTRILECLGDGQWLSNNVIDVYLYRLMQTLANIYLNMTVFIGHEVMEDIAKAKKSPGYLDDDDLVNAISNNKNHFI